MLTRADVERLPSFAIGFERGTAEGMEKGMEKGKAQLIRRLLNRSGVAEVSESLGLTPEEVERIALAGDDDPARLAKH
ncbi:MAG: hypothetical protein LGR52_15115 [Candidatus Thiosymbion ectosymbiont of Robbea hypermnestra]|nr:hypothetical protein [Candidatus Thiosymbion ectosymbiont of Robbea hypermnestra]